MYYLLGVLEEYLSLVGINNKYLVYFLVKYRS